MTIRAAFEFLGPLINTTFSRIINALPPTDHCNRARLLLGPLNEHNRQADYKLPTRDRSLQRRPTRTRPV